MAQTSSTKRWTIDELEQFADDEWHRYEIIAGELFVSTAPHFEHQLTCDMFVIEFGIWNRVARLGRVISGPGIIFSREDAVIPDVLWISHGRWAQIAGQDGKLHGAPDIAIEVLSPGTVNTRRDRVVKLRLYAEQGVEEYWLADYRKQTVAVYRRQGSRLMLHATLTRNDTLTSPLLPDFAVAVARLFDRD